MNRLILDWPLIAAIATMIAWGMNFAFVKYVLEQIGVGAFMFLRFLVLPLLGLALLVVVFRSRIRMSWPRRADLPRFVLCALVGHVLPRITRLITSADQAEIGNIPFIVRNADAVSLESVFAIESVQGPLGQEYQQLQYSQTALLNFRGMSFPHVTVGTLIKAF